MSKYDRGIVDLELNGTAYQLCPTAHVMERIDKEFGSTLDAFQSLARPTIQSVSLIVLYGSYLDSEQLGQVKEDVFQQGLMNVVGKIAPFIEALLDPNGNAGDLGEGDEGKG
jgi:hypothetical protein